MMYKFTRMWQYMRSLLVLTAALALPGAAVSYAQSAPPVLPDHTVFGRLGTGTGSGPGQAIPFTTLSTQLGISNTLAVGTTPVVGGVSGQFLYDNAGLLGVATLGTMSLQNAGAVAITGGTITGVPNLLPTATTAGTVAYWNGAAWVIFAGNTSGTQCFGENSSGVPAWTACSGGVVNTVPSGGTGQTSFTANLPILGNGSSALIQGTRTGNTTKYATSTGALVNGDCVSIDGSGNLVDAGGACTTGGGGGTVASGTATQLAYYATSGTTVSGNSAVTWTSPTLSVNVASSAITATNGTSSAKIISDIGSNQPAMDWINGTVTWQMLENTANTIGLTNGTGAGALAITTAGTYFINGSAGTAGQCLQSAGSSSPTVWASCGGGGGAVSSVSSGSGSLVIAPTTLAVVADINPSFANTFLTNQTIGVNDGGLVVNAPTSGHQADVFFNNAGTTKWTAGVNIPSTGAFSIYNNALSAPAVTLQTNNNINFIPNGGANAFFGSPSGGGGGNFYVYGSTYIGGGSPWVDVRSGANSCPAAAGNNSTDDTTAIQCQITFMNSNFGGGFVFLPPGEYKTTNTITVPGAVTLMGAGQNVSILNGSGSNFVVLEFTGNYGGMRDMYALGNQGAGASAAVVLVDVGTISGIIMNCQIQGGSFALQIAGTDWMIQNDFITGANTNGGAVISTSANHYVRDKFDGNIRANTYAFVQSTSINSSVQENHFTDCDFSSSYGYTYSLYIDDGGFNNAITISYGSVWASPINIVHQRFSSFNGDEFGANVTKGAGSTTISGSYGFSGITATGAVCGANVSITC